MMTIGVLGKVRRYRLKNSDAVYTTTVGSGAGTLFKLWD